MRGCERLSSLAYPHRAGGRGGWGLGGAGEGRELKKEGKLG